MRVSAAATERTHAHKRARAINAARANRAGSMERPMIEPHPPSPADRPAYRASDLRLTPGGLCRALIVVLGIWVLQSFLQAMLAACVTWRLMSPIDALSSSDAAATLCTFDDASLAALAAVRTWELVCSEIDDMPSEVCRICSEAPASASSASRT